MVAAHCLSALAQIHGIYSLNYAKFVAGTALKSRDVTAALARARTDNYAHN